VIALNEVRADLRLAAAWCDMIDVSARGADFYGQVILLSSGRTAVVPMVALSKCYRCAKLIDTIAQECLNLIGHSPVTYATFPPRIEVTLVKVGPRSCHDHAAALRFFKAFGMTP
jgi:hypothetical protein